MLTGVAAAAAGAAAGTAVTRWRTTRNLTITAPAFQAPHHRTRKADQYRLFERPQQAGEERVIRAWEVSRRSGELVRPDRPWLSTGTYRPDMKSLSWADRRRARSDYAIFGNAIVVEPDQLVYRP